MTTPSQFLRNAWYMACWASELADSAMLRRRLLGDPVLLFRKLDGSIAALVDRCPHRFAPLSMGTRDGDHVTCAYHGLTFDSEGACVGNPFSQTLPKAANIRSFPAAERDGIIWFWPGEPALAAAAPLPDFSALAEPWAETPLAGHTLMSAPYQYGTDNLMDLSHIEFVHKGSFAGNGVIFAGQHEVVEDGDFLHSNWYMRDVAAPPHTMGVFDPAMRCDHWLDMRWQAPASMYLAIGAVPAGAPRGDQPVMAHQAHILTPETATTTHYFWATTRGRPPSDEGDGFLRALFTQAFDDEDKPIIEAAYANLDGADFWDMKPAFLGIDAGGTRARRKLEQLIKQEQA